MDEWGGGRWESGGGGKERGEVNCGWYVKGKNANKIFKGVPPMFV